jgi:hypothetical protein
VLDADAIVGSVLKAKLEMREPVTGADEVLLTV